MAGKTDARAELVGRLLGDIATLIGIATVYKSLLISCKQVAEMAEKIREAVTQDDLQPDSAEVRADVLDMLQDRLGEMELSKAELQDRDITRRRSIFADMQAMKVESIHIGDQWVIQHHGKAETVEYHRLQADDHE